MQKFKADYTGIRREATSFTLDVKYVPMQEICIYRRRKR